MQALEIPRFSMIGWSEGGIPSQILAAKHPESMIKLILVATRSFILPKEIKHTTVLRDLIKSSSKLKTSMKEMYGDFYYDYWNKWVDGLDILIKENNRNICAHFLKDIKCPTLILHGEKDTMVDPEHALDFSAKISNSRLHMYPEGHHNIHLTYADDFNKRVQDFLLEK